MSEIDVGVRAQNIDIGAEGLNITRVNLVVDSDHMYTAGNDTGRTLEVECPWGTQAMADRILATMSVAQYRPYTAERAMVDPAFEPGDVVSVGGIYSQIISADFTYNGAGLATIGAPDLDEIEDEYPAGQNQNSSIKRQLAYTRSLISKSNEQIQLALFGEDGKGGLNGRMNTFTMSLSGISNEIKGYQDTVTGYEKQLAKYQLDLEGFSADLEQYSTDVDGYKEETATYKLAVDRFETRVGVYQEQAENTQEAYSTISQKVDNIKLSVTNENGTVSIQLKSGDTALGTPGTIDMTGLVTFSDLKSSAKTEINGDYITTGTVDAKRIKLYGPLNVYKKKTSSTIGGYLGYVEGWNPYTKDEIDDGEVNPNIGIGIMNTDTTGQCICTDQLARLSFGNYSAVIAEEGYLQLNGYGAIYFGLPEGVLTADGHPKEFVDYAVLDEEAFYCDDDGLLKLGMASHSWDVLYAGSCSCCDSDRNKKNSIEALPDKYLAMFDDLMPVRFKLNKGRSGRYHVGYIAQEVKAAMDAAGIDSTEFGGWVMDTDEDGNEIYMLRYEEFGAIYAAKIKQLEARLAKLEETA